MIKRLVKLMIKILAIVVVVAIIAVAGFVLAEPLIYGDFYNRDAEAEFATPGAGDGFVQQGMTVIDDDLILSSGYMTGGKPSRIYVTKGEDYSSRTTTYVQLKDADGDYTTNHAGGIATYGDWLYLCNSEGDPSSILVYSLPQILSAKEGDAVTALHEFAVQSNASFCTIDSNYLYVGEFYMEGKYPTDDSHRLTTPSGDKNKAVVYAYKLGMSYPYGVQNNVPVAAFSIPDKIQGMCFDDDGHVYLSSSYGIATSKIKVYDRPITATQSSITVDGASVPLYYLDSDNLVEEISAPPMIEQISYDDGKIYAMFESASNKYIFGKILRARDVWSIEVDCD